MRYSRGLRNSQKVMVRFLSVASFSGFLVGAIASQPDRSQDKGFQHQAQRQTPDDAHQSHVTGSGCLIMPAPALVWVLFREVHAVAVPRR